MQHTPGKSGTIVVIGAGAAGMVAAIFAARGGARVVVLERTPDGGRKILASGGGRCNLLPSEIDPSRYVTDSSPNTLRNILKSWPLAEQRRFFAEDAGISLAVEAVTGKIFPASNRARDVRDALARLAAESGAVLRCQRRVVAVEPRTPAGFIIRTANGESVHAGAVILTTGGLSFPDTGSDGFGLALARSTGHAVTPPYPALTSMVCLPPALPGLAGVSLEVELRAESEQGSAHALGGFIFTHRGYSGPALLNVSHVLTRPRPADGPAPLLTVRWSALDEPAWECELVAGRGTLGGTLRRHLPDRVADALLASIGVAPATTLATLRREERQRVVTALVRFELPFTGDEGFRKAEVTGGGVALAEVDPRTLESRRVPGLHFAGEVLDAFGPIGGYNFAWAWITGRLAGLGAAGLGAARRTA